VLLNLQPPGLLPVDDVVAEDDSVQQPQAARTPSIKKAAKSISPSVAQAESAGADPLTADSDMAEQADIPATTQSTRNAVTKPVEQLQGKRSQLCLCLSRQQTAAGVLAGARQTYACSQNLIHFCCGSRKGTATSPCWDAGY